MPRRRGLVVRFGAGAQCRLDAPAHVGADVAGRVYAAQGQRLCRREPHGVQAACVPREGYRSILIVEGYVRSAAFIGNALQQFDNLICLLEGNGCVARE